MTPQQIAAVLKRINWHYGKGEIREVDCARCVAIVETPVSHTGRVLTEVPYRVEGNRVRFRGQSRSARYGKWGA